MIVAIALALAASATADPEPSHLVVGPFTISSTVEAVNGFPYPAIVKTTRLQWTSADRLVSYDLQDSGELVSADMTFKRKDSENSCSATLSPLPLEPKPAAFFNAKAAMRWACITGPQDTRAVAETPELAAASYAAELTAARSEYPKAYEAFLHETHKLHGPSNVRCLKFDYGNHGPVCVRRSDE